MAGIAGFVLVAICSVDSAQPDAPIPSRLLDGRQLATSPEPGPPPPPPPDKFCGEQPHDPGCRCGNRAGLRAAWWRTCAGFSAASFVGRWLKGPGTPRASIGALECTPRKLGLAQLPGRTSAEAAWTRSCPGAARSDKLVSDWHLRSAGVWVAVVEDPIERFEWALSQLSADATAPRGASCGWLLDAVAGRGYFDARLLPQIASLVTPAGRPLPLQYLLTATEATSLACLLNVSAPLVAPWRRRLADRSSATARHAQHAAHGGRRCNESERERVAKAYVT